jgi:lipopolysaccharide transport system permease protein
VLIQRTELSELWRYRELLYFFALRDIKVRYKQAALGVMWAIIQPLFTMIIFTIFFGRLAGIPSDGIPYPLFSLCALVPWTYFSSTLSQGGTSLVANTNLITKVYFPRILLPAATAVGGLLDFLIGSVLLIALMLYYGMTLGWATLLYPVLSLIMMILAVGVSMILAAINVRYRDVKYVIPFLVQLWLFLTPIIYPASFVPERYRALLALNPMYGIIEGFRASLFPGRQIDFALIGLSLCVSLLVFLIGALYFQRTQKQFADII